jgi:hypothetical protein
MVERETLLSFACPRGFEAEGTTGTSSFSNLFGFLVVLRSLAMKKGEKRGGYLK